MTVGVYRRFFKVAVNCLFSLVIVLLLMRRRQSRSWNWSTDYGPSRSPGARHGNRLDQHNAV